VGEKLNDEKRKKRNMEKTEAQNIACLAGKPSGLNNEVIIIVIIII